ncbi:TetR/AcrR family transcriptional regulator [Cellulomonas xylanilytica]|uniref:TetR family transcriptional regulator n=1 Tax=Cellulomonas xylanilytica TaxID=233583 RepID=A0A510VED8_9CELL|nr:helix-turn-helix domain-containing protein [Cellulomonas xylanilytica]GEK23495.1 TetR family transcriptional regulator [Cellulomonas xylanilytica]
MSSLSSAELRIPVVTAAAVREFARGGYHGTTIADVAAAARISPAYVFKLFPGKERLFVAALEDCFQQIVETLTIAAEEATGSGPDGILDAMGGAYAQLISDRSLLMLQVHAQSVADVPEIGQALRAGLASVVRLAKARSGASDEAVQRFIAYGQLCHLIVTTGVDDVTDDWAVLVARGIRHPA